MRGLDGAELVEVEDEEGREPGVLVQEEPGAQDDGRVERHQAVEREEALEQAAEERRRAVDERKGHKGGEGGEDERCGGVCQRDVVELVEQVALRGVGQEAED